MWTSYIVTGLLLILGGGVIYGYNTLVFLVKLFTCLVVIQLHCRKYGGKVYSYADEFEQMVDRDPNRVQFITVEDGKETTLGQLEKEANHFAGWGIANDYSSGNTIALMLLNKPSVVSFLVGFAKIGVATAHINTGASGKVLIHAIEVATAESKTKVAVIDSELRSQVENDIASLKERGIRVIFWDDLYNEVTTKFPSTRPDRKLRSTVKESDPLMYIFTSGTTGLPKSSKISHTRFFIGGVPFRYLCSLKPSDRVYCVLPLYHSSAILLNVPACMWSGAVCVLRRKFSASNFTKDCVKYKINVFQYIGELCRYLINHPVSSVGDPRVKLDYIFGNGMLADVWPKFVSTFNVQNVCEFYGATEGNCNLFNGTGRVGSCGYIPPILDVLYPLKIVRPDPENQDIPMRDPKTGLCVPVNDEREPGLLIGKITGDISRRFEGYTDKKASEKKVLFDVLAKGDSWFNSGDLLTRDSAGYFYWSDRVGDTFRWKGENVATTEVETVIQSCKDLRYTMVTKDGKEHYVFNDVTVFGIRIPNADGKAGMAAMMFNREGVEAKGDNLICRSEGELQIDWAPLIKEFKAHLPAFARPLIIRIDRELPLTTTFKKQKNGFVTEGFNPDMVFSSHQESNSVTPAALGLYAFSSKADTYIPLTKKVFEEINNGTFEW